MKRGEVRRFCPDRAGNAAIAAVRDPSPDGFGTQGEPPLNIICVAGVAEFFSGFSKISLAFNRGLM